MSRVAERERDEARAALEGCRSAMIAWAASDGFVLPDEASEAFDAASRLLGLPESVADRDSCMPAEHADDEADVTEAQEWADFDPDC